MKICSNISDGIRMINGRHEIREDLVQEVVPVVTPSPPSSPEGITNERYAPHNVGETHDHTGEANRVWIGFGSLFLGFSR